MTALLVIAALFGGLCLAGRSRRSSDTYIVDDYADNYCDGGDITCGDGCASDDYNSSSASENSDD